MLNYVYQRRTLNMKQELLKGLSEEQIAKIKSCKNSEDLLSLAKVEGVELTDEQLSAISGGGCFSTIKCPKCGCTKHYKEEKYVGTAGASTITTYTCKDCGYKWIE